ncbi:2-dehydropantoate 2-reductase [Vibrio diazotrophicus]|uniref:2-dehydropantoate 2-reductase n=1 Tax=Vibrio diazotrophicus TaxID=685 RepID=UPI00142DB20F|nr:2-dehydropantoate 2-reductase [Vibrio diazotrophicus]NIY92823.1 2-dehydropantoate 2-reductase [Vibrio diazotrophicus]
MNIVIVGPGAIGSLWAYKLHQAGHKVSLWGTKQNQQWMLAADDSPEISFNYNQPQTLIDADLLLITVKAWQVEAAITPLLPHVNKDAILLFMHNGMGAVEDIAELISDYPVVIATTTHGALKTDAHHVKHSGVGQTQLGAFNFSDKPNKKGEQCTFLVDVLNHALPAVSWNSNIQLALWNKLAINCAINPLTAIHQCLNGELAEEKFRPTLNAVVDELVSVMQAEKIPVDRNQLTTTFDNVIRATAANKSSMHQDIFYRRQTEIDFITGYLVRKAQQHGIEVPANTELYKQIKLLEQQRKTS